MRTENRIPQLITAIVMGGFIGFAITGSANGTGIGALVAVVIIPLIDYWWGL